MTTQEISCKRQVWPYLEGRRLSHITAITQAKGTLVTYAVKAITGGTDAQGEVMVKVEEGPKTVTGLGADTDIIVLRRPILSPGGAFLARPPRRTKSTPASSSLARSLRRASVSAASQERVLTYWRFWKSKKDDAPKISYI